MDIKITKCKLVVKSDALNSRVIPSHYENIVEEIEDPGFGELILLVRQALEEGYDNVVVNVASSVVELDETFNFFKYADVGNGVRWCLKKE